MTNLEKFIEEYKKVYQAHITKYGYNWLTVDNVILNSGRKYHKLVVDNSATAFIDKQTGDIFKPANWNAPAKHARGNINSPTFGMEAFDSYGFVKYLK